MADLFPKNQPNPIWSPNSGRRAFIGKLAAVAAAGSVGTASLMAEGVKAEEKSKPGGQARALLVSATTLVGHKSLEHAEVHLRNLFSGAHNILLINFASLPDDRDAYAARMQRDFARIDNAFQVNSLHTASIRDARQMVAEADAIYVSGGNTFLLLKELYDRNVVGLIRERVEQGIPYAGSSAGSNIAGMDIGTTNDFPLVDLPTRRALGLLPGTYNPHHPDPEDKDAFDARQYKIRQHARYHPLKPVFGINNAGMISIAGGKLTLLGDGGIAVIQLGTESVLVRDQAPGNLTGALEKLKAGQHS